MSTWILTTDAEIDGLLELASGIGEPIVVAAIGDRALAEACGDQRVSRIAWFDTAGGVAESSAPSLVRAAAGEQARLVLATPQPTHQVLAGALTAGLSAEAFTDVQRVTEAGAELVVTHLVHTGISQLTVATTRPVVALATRGGPASRAARVPTVQHVVTATMVVVSTSAPASEDVDIAKAERLVVAGRGIKAATDLAMVERIAGLLGADLACTRPLAEGLGWLPHDRYVGVSGKTVRPRLFLAVGVSGQFSHLAGARDAETVIAVNLDPGAPVFAACDLGIVADLYDVVPALESALRDQPTP